MVHVTCLKNMGVYMHVWQDWHLAECIFSQWIKHILESDRKILVANRMHLRTTCVFRSVKTKIEGVELMHISNFKFDRKKIISKGLSKSHSLNQHAALWQQRSGKDAWLEQFHRRAFLSVHESYFHLHHLSLAEEVPEGTSTHGIDEQPCNQS